MKPNPVSLSLWFIREEMRETNTELSLLLKPSHTHTHTHTHTHPHPLTPSHTLSHSLTLSHTLTPTISHTHPVNMHDHVCLSGIFLFVFCTSLAIFSSYASTYKTKIDQNTLLYTFSVLLSSLCDTVLRHCKDYLQIVHLDIISSFLTKKDNTCQWAETDLAVEQENVTYQANSNWKPVSPSIQ